MLQERSTEERPHQVLRADCCLYFKLCPTVAQVQRRCRNYMLNPVYLPGPDAIISTLTWQHKLHHYSGSYTGVVLQRNYSCRSCWFAVMISLISCPVVQASSASSSYSSRVRVSSAPELVEPPQEMQRKHSSIIIILTRTSAVSC